MRTALKSGWLSSLLSVPSTSGNPTDAGVSGNLAQRKNEQASAMPAGTRKQRRQFMATRYPQSTTITPAPIECDIFQIDNFVASCFGGNQCVNNRAQGGKPIP